MITIGSICTGYGGLDAAVEQVLGGRVVFVADIDKGANKILAHRYPDVPNLGDISKVDWTQHDIDILVGGFPCQDLSYAGQGAGIQEGNRSGLWYVIADAVGILRPRIIALENVNAIVVRRPGMDVVLGDLAALGYDAVWVCVRASDVGAPHRRERWFCIAWDASCSDETGSPPYAADGNAAGAGSLREAVGRVQREEPGTGRPVASADAVGGELQRRGGSGLLAGPEGQEQGEVRQRERDGHPADRGGSAAGNPAGQGLQGSAVGRGEREEPGEGRGDAADSARARGGCPRERALDDDPGDRGTVGLGADAGQDGAAADAGYGGVADGSRPAGWPGGERPPVGPGSGSGGDDAAADSGGERRREVPGGAPGDESPDARRAAAPDHVTVSAGEERPAADAERGGLVGRGRGHLGRGEGTAATPGRRRAEEAHDRVAGEGRPGEPGDIAAADSEHDGLPAREDTGEDQGDAGAFAEWLLELAGDGGEQAAADAGRGDGEPRQELAAQGREPDPGSSGGPGVPVDWRQYEPAIRQWERILGRPAPAPTELGPNGPRLSARFTEWMMGLPDGWVTGVPGMSRAEQLKALGNGVVPQQAAYALRILLESLERIT